MSAIVHPIRKLSLIFNKFTKNLAVERTAPMLLIFVKVKFTQLYAMPMILKQHVPIHIKILHAVAAKIGQDHIVTLLVEFMKFCLIFPM